MRRIKLWQLNVLLALVLIGVAVLGLCTGVKWESLTLLWRAPASLDGRIMWTIRIPRILSVVMVGALLSVSGLLMQSLSRNPIADPSILGVNAGAMLALIIGSLLGMSLSIVTTIWLSLVGAAVAFTAVLLIAMTRQGLDVLRFILGGTVFSSFISCLAYAGSLLTNTTMQFRNLLVGGFSAVTYAHVRVLCGGLIIVLATILLMRKQLSLLVLDDTTARSLGAKPGLTRVVAALLVVISAGISVAVAGNIGFVGLGIPQMINYVHPDRLERNVVPTVLLGAIFMMVVDIVAKTLAAPSELPLSALSAICGGIFLLLVIMKGARVTER